MIRFDVNGADAPTVSARLLNNRGDDLTPLAATRTPRGTYEIDLALRSIARGDFVMGIHASAGDQQAEVFVPLRILR